MFGIKKVMSAKEKEARQLRAELAKTKSALDAAYSTFENVTDHDLIDYSIYEMNAIQKRYHFLLKRAKELGEAVTE